MDGWMEERDTLRWASLPRTTQLAMHLDVFFFLLFLLRCLKVQKQHTQKKIYLRALDLFLQYGLVGNVSVRAERLSSHDHLQHLRHLIPSYRRHRRCGAALRLYLMFEQQRR